MLWLLNLVISTYKYLNEPENKLMIKYQVDWDSHRVPPLSVLLYKYKRRKYNKYIPKLVAHWLSASLNSFPPSWPWSLKTQVSSFNSICYRHEFAKHVRMVFWVSSFFAVRNPANGRYMYIILKQTEPELTPFEYIILVHKPKVFPTIHLFPRNPWYNFML